MNKILFLFIFISYVSVIFAQEPYRDPFEKRLPKIVSGIVEEIKEYIAPPVAPPAIEISGILLGYDGGRVIIDGEVYKEGDKVVSRGVEIRHIDKDKVTILYQGKLFEIGIEKK